LVVVSGLVFLAQEMTRRVSNRVSFFSALACATALLFLAEGARRTGPLAPPWAQWLQAAPAICFGFVIYKLLQGPKTWWEVAAVCTAPLLYSGFSQFSDPGLATTYLIAVPLTTMAFLLQVDLPHPTAVLGSLCMGVYVLHGGLISLLKYALPSTGSAYLLFVLTALFAFAATLLLKRVPLVRAVL
jgi:hypothetical protein